MFEINDTLNYNSNNYYYYYDPFKKNKDSALGSGKEGWTIYRDYDIICNFFENKIRKDLPMSKVNSFLLKRGVRKITITLNDVCLELTMELGYVEFCNVEYNYTLSELIKLIMAIKLYFDKYKKQSNAYIYLQRPSPVA